MIKQTIFLCAIISIFSGCTNKTSTVKPEPCNIKKETQKLKTTDKKTIYQTIKQEIHKYKKEGDKAYKKGYYSDALQYYKKVNFYENTPVISKSKITYIKQKADKKSKRNYNKLKYCTNKKQKLSILNTIMMNNPEYKDSKKLLKKIKDDREIKIFLNHLQNDLYMKIANYQNTTKELKNINTAYKRVVKYDYQNKIAKESEVFLHQEWEKLIKEAKENYEKNHLKTASREFKTISSIYKDDKVSRDYLRKTKAKQNIKTNLIKAQNALNKQHYIEAIELSKTVLDIAPKNEKANTIKLQAQNGCNIEISKLIDSGMKKYEQKNLDGAKHDFVEVLKLDPHNNTSAIYIQKIQRQLKTIKSLKG